LDFGCGAWQFSRFVRWGEVDHTGVDIVGPVIAANRERYGRPGVRFQLYSGDPFDLPPADLLIAKDVLQHWPNRDVSGFLSVIGRYPYALITNCVNPAGVTSNDDIPAGGSRFASTPRSPSRL